MIVFCFLSSSSLVNRPVHWRFSRRKNAESSKKIRALNVITRMKPVFCILEINLALGVIAREAKQSRKQHLRFPIKRPSPKNPLTNHKS
jgi:hypothetical protein